MSAATNWGPGAGSGFGCSIRKKNFELQKIVDPTSIDFQLPSGPTNLPGSSLPLAMAMAHCFASFSLRSLQALTLARSRNHLAQWTNHFLVTERFICLLATRGCCCLWDPMRSWSWQPDLSYPRLWMLMAAFSRKGFICKKRCTWSQFHTLPRLWKCFGESKGLLFASTVQWCLVVSNDLGWNDPIIDSANDCSNTYTNDGTNACKFIAANGMKQNLMPWGLCYPMLIHG